MILALFAAIGYALVWYLWPSKNDGGREADETKPRPAPRGDLSARDDAAWFEVLGVAEGASTEEITRAYRSLIAQYHPDRVAQMGPEIRELAGLKTQQINKAYEVGMAWRRIGQ